MKLIGLTTRTIYLRYAGKGQFIGMVNDVQRWVVNGWDRLQEVLAPIETFFLARLVCWLSDKLGEKAITFASWESVWIDLKLLKQRGVTTQEAPPPFTPPSHLPLLLRC